VSGPPAAAETLDFETAYCLHREREALAALERIADRGGRERHLEAQVVRTVDRIRS
jgi:hypothetical protein